MFIDFDKLEEAVLPEFKGGEGVTLNRAFSDGFNKIMRGRLPVGSLIGYHKHEDNSEIVLILSGEARLLYDDGEELLTAGDCHYCPSGHSHSLINNSKSCELEFFAVVPEHKKLCDFA
ncbi:MAG: cupin domain-containing protein [Ruminococcus sp.]|nr:cupin domain-containing protein [Ruminococcus sp.]